MNFVENSYERKKVKVLCLRGIGTNSEVGLISSVQTRQITNRSKTAALRSSKIYRSYFDESGDSLKRALDNFDQYVTEMGFSLGAAFAATILLRNEMRRSKSEPHYPNLAKTEPRLKCAIFLCETLPSDLNSLEYGDIRALQAKDVQSVITIPTSRDLVQMCEERNGLNSYMKEDIVPHQGNELRATTAAVPEIINRTT
ncbi:hypothetical protein EAF04_010691 [Stromatinia cepivora]|nr:hypothetical protein EAF04_010691 [Stromatinia cepivora]